MAEHQGKFMKIPGHLWNDLSIDFPMPNFFHGFPTELMTHWTPFLGTLCGKVAPWIQFHEEKK